MLELAILGLVKEQDMHGYELKKRLAETVGAGAGVSFGSLYPALGRLVAAGALRIVAAGGGGDGIPMTGALTGELAALRSPKADNRGTRGKKVYAITSQGEQLFEELLAADAGSSEDERAFKLRLAFARHLPKEARIGMLERRRAYLLARLDRTKNVVRHGWERFDAYTRSLMEHGNETTERDISWLDLLIARERAEASPASPAWSPDVAMGAAPHGPGGSAPTELAGVTASSWAAATAPTMPARPAPRHAPARPADPQPPVSPANQLPAQPAPQQLPAQPAPQQLPAQPADQQSPVPPALRRGGTKP